MAAPDLVAGQFFPPLSSKSQPAHLRIGADAGAPQLAALLADGSTVENLAFASLQAGDTLHFADGSSFAAYRPLPPALVARFESRTRRRIGRLEAFSLPKTLAFGLALVLCVLGFRAAIPVAAHAIALALPERIESLAGAHTYSTLKAMDLADSALPEARQAELRRRAAALAEAARLTRRPEIVFHRSRLFGANAMALPGGPIVVTDDLVGLLDTDDAVLAVLAHEMAHVEKRHALQQVLALAGAAALASVVFGVDDNLIEEISATLINVWGFKNSRNFEKEADLDGVAILRAGGVDPALLLSSIAKLMAHGCTKQAEAERARCLETAESGETGWLATHPGAKERLEYLRQALGG